MLLNVKVILEVLEQADVAGGLLCAVRCKWCPGTSYWPAVPRCQRGHRRGGAALDSGCETLVETPIPHTLSPPCGKGGASSRHPPA